MHQESSLAILRLQGRREFPFLLGIATRAFLLLIPLVAVLVISQRSEWNPTLDVGIGHFYITVPVAILATLIAFLVTYASLELQDVRLFLLALGFFSMGVIFAVHGLATPGVLLSINHDGTVGFAAYLALTLGAVFFFLSTVNLPTRFRVWVSSRLRGLLAVAVVLLTAFALISLLAPGLLDRVPLHGSSHGGGYEVEHYYGYGESSYGEYGKHETHEEYAEYGGYGEHEEYGAYSDSSDKGVASWILIFVNLFLLGIAAIRSFAAYLLSKLALQGSIVVGTVLLMESQIALQSQPVSSLAWWLYHPYLILGFGVILYAVVSEQVGGRSLTATIGQLAPRDVLEQIKHGMGDSVVALAAAAEARDSYTYDHISRVAELSVAIGRAIGMPNLRLRSLAQGAMLHDIGKLYISDTVLLKPDKLTAEEYRSIKQHPSLGYELLGRLGGFSREALIVRHHHEWWDGSGYPDGLKGEEIPLEARIVAVADVYDALTTDRPYRRALSPAEAIAIVKQEAGSHLDPGCVDAFLRVVGSWRLEHQRAVESALAMNPAQVTPDSQQVRATPPNAPNTTPPSERPAGEGPRVFAGRIVHFH